MLIDLGKCFPPDKSGNRAPLPKQQTFIDDCLDPNGPKYIAYYGGVGSGKSLILCISILTMGVLHGGEYIIARQYMPELRRTTWKTFLELVPKELIIEVRVADAEVHIRSAKGKAIFYFVGLDEHDKIRSMNISGFGIDEASQVSEGAFLQLQSRLRNTKGLRKGLLVGNPAGHDWVYNFFIKQDLFNNPKEKLKYKMVVAPSTENIHLPDGYVESMMNTWSKDRIGREIMGSFDAFSGAVYSEFRRDVHVIPPFKTPDDWTRVVGADHGYRNPSCWLWGAVDYDGNVFIYREFYQKEWLIEEICKGKKIYDKPGVLDMMTDPETGKLETIQGVYIDPSTRNRRGTTGKSDWDAYVECLPESISLLPARNDKTAGIDRVKSYLKLDPRTNKPRLFIFDTCENLIEELSTYRYEELPSTQQGKKAEKEEPRKVNDHACDAARYMLMSRPETTQAVDDIWDKLKYNSLEGALYRDLAILKKKTPSDPYSGML